MPTTFPLALRRLARAPILAATSVLTLTLGIGGTTAVFSVLRAVLLEPLPYRDAGRLVDLSHSLALTGATSVDQSDATYLYYRQANRVFTGVGAYRATSASIGPTRESAGGAGAFDPERVSAALTSASTFAVLDAAPVVGRLLLESDDQPGAPAVAVISQRLWERKYGADRGIIGRRIDVDGVPREVVGVMPGRFRFPAARTDVWLPIGIDPANTKTAAFDYRAVARLRPSVTLAGAAADLDRLLPLVPEAYPGRLTRASIEQIHMRAVVRPLRDVVVGDVGRTLWLALGAVAFVLLVACANVANLFLVRADARRHELAIRRALGATGQRLAGDVLSEGVIVAAVGGILGGALAVAAVGVLRALGGSAIPRLDEVGVDAVAILAGIALTTLAALLVSALPAWRAAAAPVAGALGNAGRSSTTGPHSGRARDVLVVAQVALALVLLVASGLMARSVARLGAVPPGFDAAGAATFRVALPDASYPGSRPATQFAERLIDSLATLPGVTAVGAISKLPLDETARRDTALFVESRPLAPGTMPNLHQVAYATPGYFAAMGIPLLEGRPLSRPDAGRLELEVVVSRALAARYWPAGRAVGNRVQMAPLGPWHTVVGVAGDVRGGGLDQSVDETIYLPLVTAPGPAVAGGAGASPFTPHDLAYIVRGGADVNATSALASRVAGVVRGIDPTVPVYSSRSMREVLGGATARARLTLLLLAVAAGTALVLGAVGIYGVISYAVSLRAREIAVRLAIGARGTEVRGLVARHAARLAMAGILAGLAGSVVLGRVMAAVLFEVRPTDPLTLLAAAAAIFAIALAASWAPAVRASRVDPASVLRS